MINVSKNTDLGNKDSVGAYPRGIAIVNCALNAPLIYHRQLYCVGRHISVLKFGNRM